MPKNTLLIGGTGRSGTSILNRIFSNHPDITDIPEWRFLTDPDGIIDFYNSSRFWSPYHYDIRLKRLESLLYSVNNGSSFHRIFKAMEILKFGRLVSRKIVPRYSGIRVHRYCPDFSSHVQNLICSLKQFSFSGTWVGASLGSTQVMYYNYFHDRQNLIKLLSHFLESVIKSALKKQDCKYYLEKNTWNILWYDSILELLPNAKMVHIFRDPRDVVASYTKQKWMPSDPIQSAVIYRDMINRWWSVRKNLSTDCYFEISLENLVSDPKKVLLRICDFWNIPWSERLLDVKLNQSHTGRWKRDLTIKQQREVEKLLFEEMVKLGYPVKE